MSQLQWLINWLREHSEIVRVTQRALEIVRS